MTLERMLAGDKMIEVARFKITEAGRLEIPNRHAGGALSLTDRGRAVLGVREPVGRSAHRLPLGRVNWRATLLHLQAIQ